MTGPSVWFASSRTPGLCGGWAKDRQQEPRGGLHGEVACMEVACMVLRAVVPAVVPSASGPPAAVTKRRRVNAAACRSWTMAQVGPWHTHKWDHGTTVTVMAQR
jgi:hypothetical protein